MAQFDNRWTRMTRRHEGVRNKPYFDPIGKAYTIGIGHNLTTHGEKIPESWTPEQIESNFKQDYYDAEDRAIKIVGNKYFALNDMQQAILNDMAFQMNDKLGSFHNMISAIREDRVGDVPREMLDSEWARKQTPKRAKELAQYWVSDPEVEQKPTY